MSRKCSTDETSSSDRSIAKQSFSSRRKFVAAMGSVGVSTAIAGCGSSGGDGGGSDGGDGGDGGGGDGGGGGDPSGDQVRTLAYLTLSPDLNPPRYGWSEMHANNLRELGFEIDIQAASGSEYIDRAWITREFDFYAVRWADGFDPDRVLTDVFDSASLAEGGGNIAGYENPEYDELNAQQRQETDREARQELVYQCQEMVMEDQPITPVFVEQRFMPYNSDRYTNIVSQLENGLDSLWTMINIESTSSEHEPLIYTQPEELSTLNPITPQRGRVDRGANRIMYDRLMQWSADASEVVPWLAEEVNQPDNTTYELKLREGHTWHDGEPVTAEDVRFTMDYGREHSAAIQNVLEPVDNIEVETDLDLTISLSRPNAPFAGRAFAGRDSSILPQHIWEDIPESIDAESPLDWGNTDNPIGSGPWMATDFTLGEEMRLEAHEDHWNPPNVSEAVRIQASDERTAINMMEDGTADMLSYGALPDDIPRLQDMNHISLDPSFMTSIHYCSYNMRREPFDNKAVRHAMAHALPKAEAVEVQLDERGDMLTTCFSTGLEYWYNENTRKFPYDMEQARQILADAGFEWDSDGMIHYPS